MAAITIITVGSRGDVEPYVALGAGLVAAGHDVRIATHRGFAEAVDAAGLGFVAVPGDPREIIASVEGAAWQGSGTHPLRIAAGLRRIAAPLADAFLDAAVEAVIGADLVLFSALAVAGHHAAEAAGIRSVGAWLQPLTATRQHPHLLLGRLPLPSATHLAGHRVVEQATWRLVARQDGRWRKALGLRPLGPGGPYHLVADGTVPVLYGMSPTLVPPPADWPPTVEVTGVWSRPGPPLDQAVEAFARAGSPPVVIGFGSRLGDDPDRAASVVAEALDRTGMRAVVLGGWGGIAPTVADERVLTVDSAPHDTLFPLASAIVHHGGAGTTHAAAASGVPVAVVPTFADQFFWADRVVATGSGVRLDALTADSLGVALERLTRRPWPGAARTAARLGAEDGVATAVEAVGRLLA